MAGDEDLRQQQKLRSEEEELNLALQLSLECRREDEELQRVLQHSAHSPADQDGSGYINTSSEAFADPLGEDISTFPDTTSEARICDQCGEIKSEGHFGFSDTDYAGEWFCMTCWQSWPAECEQYMTQQPHEEHAQEDLSTPSEETNSNQQEWQHEQEQWEHAQDHPPMMQVDETCMAADELLPSDTQHATMQEPHLRQTGDLQRTRMQEVHQNFHRWFRQQQAQAGFSMFPDMTQSDPHVYLSPVQVMLMSVNRHEAGAANDVSLGLAPPPEFDFDLDDLYEDDEVAAAIASTVLSQPASADVEASVASRERQRLLAEQDAEFEESLRVDQERQAASQQDAEAEEKRQDSREELMSESEHRAQQRELRLRAAQARMMGPSWITSPLPNSGAPLVSESAAAAASSSQQQQETAKEQESDAAGPALSFDEMMAELNEQLQDASAGSDTVGCTDCGTSSAAAAAAATDVSDGVSRADQDSAQAADNASSPEGVAAASVDASSPAATGSNNSPGGRKAVFVKMDEADEENELQDLYSTDWSSPQHSPQLLGTGAATDQSGAGDSQHSNPCHAAHQRAAEYKAQAEQAEIAAKQDEHMTEELGRLRALLRMQEEQLVDANRRERELEQARALLRERDTELAVLQHQLGRGDQGSVAGREQQ